MTNRNAEFAPRQDREGDEITNGLYNQLRPLGGSPSGETKQSLRGLVTRVAKPGHEMAEVWIPIIKDQNIKLGRFSDSDAKY